MKLERAVILTTFAILGNREVRQATVYLSADLVVHATARARVGKVFRFRDLILKVGKPNFVQRRFIRLCEKAGEPLPVRRVQLKFWSKKR